MALIWADFPSGSQGIYGNSLANTLNGIWAGVEGVGGDTALTNDPDPAIGAAGKVLETASRNIILSGLRFALPAGPTATVGVGVRLWLNQLPDGNWSNASGPLIGLRNIANGPILYLTVLANGAIAIATNTGGVTLLGTTATSVITANSYNHIEMKVTRHASAGTCEVRVNGSTVLNLTGLALGADNPALVFFGSNSENAGVRINFSWWKDIVIWDTAGAQNNDFLGSVSVYALRPTSDVVFPWAASSGTTGWNLIDEAPPVDSDYIIAGDPPPALCQFQIENLPPDIVSVRGLIPVIRARKIDGGDGNLQVGLVGTLADLGADRPMTTAFSYHWDVSELSPDTAAPWTPVEVDAVKLQVNRTI